MQELAFEQVEIVVGGEGNEGESSDSVNTDTTKVKQDAAGCSIPSLGEAASAYGVGFGTGVTVGAATGYSVTATAVGYIGIALVGSAMAGYSLGVGINHMIGACD